MSLLSPSQARFVSTLSAETGLNPKVVGAWALAEQSGSAAKNYESRGINNWLNVGNVDSNPSAGNKFKVWSDPVTAARATAEWLKGGGQITKEYGRAAPGILNIPRMANYNPVSQIGAIAHSGWASSGYDGGATLQALYGQLGGEKLPPAGTSLTPGGNQAHAASASTTSTFNQGAYEKAQKVALANRLLTEGSGGSILRGVLPTSVGPSAFEHTSAAKLPAAPKTETKLSASPKAPTGSGFTAGPGTNYTKVTPELVAHLNSLGSALKVHLVGISGYRTPQHSVEVGGFADDPHTKGLASDTEGAQQIPKSVLNKYGLERPFPGAKEADHIQLLHSVNKNGGY